MPFTLVLGHLWYLIPWPSLALHPTRHTSSSGLQGLAQPSCFLWCPIQRNPRNCFKSYPGNMTSSFPSPLWTVREIGSVDILMYSSAFESYNLSKVSWQCLSPILKCVKLLTYAFCYFPLFRTIKENRSNMYLKN